MFDYVLIVAETGYVGLEKFNKISDSEYYLRWLRLYLLEVEGNWGE